MTLTDLTKAAAIDAHRRIEPYVRRTPMLPLDIGGDSQIWLKTELFQPTGSFKVRGVFNKVLQLSPEQLAQGVVSMSAGNHAVALALVARSQRIPAVIVMPQGASQSKVDAARALGAEIILTDDPLEQKMNEVRRERDLTLVHPFDDLQVVLGASTTGIEMVEDSPPLDAIAVPIGGGGLIGGIAFAVKAFSPSTKLIGVEPRGADAMHRALAVGVDSQQPFVQDTVADGLKAPYAGRLPFSVVRECVDEVVYVDESDIAGAFSIMYRTAKLACEPSAAVGLAAIRAHWRLFSGANVATVVSGGNVDAHVVLSLLEA